jgi:hypothetical protein
MKIIPTYENFINESIRAKEAYSEEGAIQTVLSGKRDLMFLAITAQKLLDPRPHINTLQTAINAGLNILPIKGRTEGVSFIVYNKDRKTAEEFAKFVTKKNGYLRDDSPEDAEYIGKMLNYDPQDIAEYIERVYGV